MQSLRGYVARQLSREVAETSRDREACSRLAADTSNLRAELSRLKSQVRGSGMCVCLGHLGRAAARGAGRGTCRASKTREVPGAWVGKGLDT